VGHRKKRPRTRVSPHPHKQPKSEPPGPRTVQWSFAIYDPDIQWGTDDGANEPFRNIARRLKQYESMSWSEIERNRRRDHWVALDQLSKRARDRLMEIRQDDIDALWRFRFSGEQRLWGIRVGNVFRILWWDPEHEVCPSHLRGT
jgi:hypothetical protein